MANTKQQLNMKTDNTTTDENEAVSGNQLDTAACSVGVHLMVMEIIIETHEGLSAKQKSNAFDSLNEIRSQI